MEGWPEPVMQAPPELFVESWPEPVIEAPRESLVETWPEPVIEPPLESLVESWPEPPIEPSWNWLMEGGPEPVMQAPPESLVDSWPEPVIEAPRESLVESWSEPVIEAPREQLMEGWPEAVTEALCTLLSLPDEPVIGGSREPSEGAAQEISTQDWPEPTQVWPGSVTEASLGPLVEASVMETPVRPLEETWLETSAETPRDPLVGPLREAWPQLVREPLWEPSMDVPQEPLVEGPREPFGETFSSSSMDAWNGYDLVARVWKECLEKEKGLHPVLRPDEELKVVMLAEAAILKELSGGKTREDLSISDFEACSWRWLKLVLLMHEWQDKGGGFREVISALESFLARPVGVNDTWFLAGVVQRFITTGYLSRWLPRTVPPQSGWHCRKTVCRVSFPDEVVRLPETEESVNRVWASSLLDWWFRQAQRNIRIDKNTWKIQEPLSTVLSVQQALGKQAFENAIEVMKRVIPPPRQLSSVNYLCCLLQYFETSPLIITRARRPLACRPRPCPDPRSIPPEVGAMSTPSSPSLADVDRSVGANRSVAVEMTTFMTRVLQECLERERLELAGASRLSTAMYAIHRFRTALCSQKKSTERIARKPKMNPFDMCGWRWLCLVGLMNDNLKPHALQQLIADSEKIVPRPKHVSPLWYLACRMQACLKGRDISQKLRWPWWAFNTIYRDHFPETFGELPMSETSVRLIAFSSRAAHWIASGIRKFRLTRKTWSVTSSRDIVDIFHTVLGHHRFNEAIDLIKPKICKIAPDEGPQQMQQLQDKCIMGILFKYARVARKVSCRFCRSWQFDVDPNPKGSDEVSSSEDEPPAKKVR
ncbi:hypothetical protein GNI_012620 [Gregarina niphandrodes]|uniref:Uncharacterized protein n=1 Tax=Gregarina niphandrodes TaxID=110365 RepID=A0A023BCM5_GRENI|nr:hypothetical protein GNI_012620 [Gregarina niphandrodes]EZG84531.1 hypothetical protein GNI_012620 [Gregarina niphandrodes]|eukprot:XP_011128859.1 hypothetical protein GNI_012620 [Gregarina niphandrodes]